MAISFNTGATASAVTATSVGITIPAGVLTGDVMVMALEVFTATSTTPTISFSGGGGGWTLVPMTSGTNPEVATAGSANWSYGFAYYRVATAGDPGATVTVSESGSAAGSTWLAVAMGAYTGASTSSPVDVAAGNNAQGVVAGTGPTVTTVQASDWALQLACVGISGVTLTGPATSRENIVSSASIGAAVDDGNASVASSTLIGGGTWTDSGSGSRWWSLFTIGLAPATPAAPPTGLVPRIPHPLWNQLLEVAWQRADWQAQGAPSLQQQHWRLMDGAGGRPGTGSSGTQPPATATGSGTNINGTSFYVSQGGCWLEGYWWFVCSAGGQSVSAQKFCLWSDVSSGGTVVPGSAVTSGTLSAGWNYIPLPQPVQLAIWGQYTAATGLTGTFPQTSGQFSSGGPYQGGIANTPLYAFSDNNGTNPAPYSYGQGATIAASSTDPALTQPVSDANAGTNFWLDVQVTNTAPAGYSGSYRLWPNMADWDSNAAPDSAVNYVIGTEVLLSQACVVSAIWYYRPSVTTQFATSADIWRVRDGVRVATQPSPTWTVASGAPAPAAGGQWVRCEMPGVTLPAGDYYVTVYDGNASPDQWSAKSLGWWQAVTVASGGRGTPDGTFLHSPPGANGITCGPLYAPTTPAASDIQDYAQAPAVEPGQSVFATGPPNQVPNRYVGQSSSGIYTGPALFQNYYVDAEVIPASVFVPDAPVLPPRIPHPLYLQLLEVAAERLQGQGAASALPGPPPPLPALQQSRGLLQRGLPQQPQSPQVPQPPPPGPAPQQSAALVRQGLPAQPQSIAVPGVPPPLPAPQQATALLQQGLPVSAPSPQLSGAPPPGQQPQNAASLLRAGLPQAPQYCQVPVPPPPVPASQQSPLLIGRGLAVAGNFAQAAAVVPVIVPMPGQPQAVTLIWLGLPQTESSPQVPPPAPPGQQPQNATTLIRLGLPTPGNFFQAPPVAPPVVALPGQQQSAVLLTLGLPTPGNFFQAAAPVVTPPPPAQAQPQAATLLRLRLAVPASSAGAPAVPGRLTATDAAAGVLTAISAAGSILTASDQRTGGPG